MARVTLVQKARKAQGGCRRCGTAIEPGDSYYHFSNRIGRSSVRKVFCEEHRPRASEMTTSDKLSQLYAAQEQVDDSLDGLDPTTCDVTDFESIRDELMEAVRAVGEEYTESADNMVEGFGHDTYMSDEIREKGEACEQWAGDIEGLAFEEFDEDDVPDADAEEDRGQQRAAWFEEQSTTLSDMAGECPV